VSLISEAAAASSDALIIDAPPPAPAKPCVR
jgi:hypothetical protein